MMDAEAAARELGAGLAPCGNELALDFGGFAIRLRTNAPELIARLKDYFRHAVAPVAEPHVDILAWERAAPEFDENFVDWKRDGGKTGRKDAYADLPDARLVRKVRTGMMFLQSENKAVAAGPCLANDNQVINFVNAQYMNWLQRRGWMICHAAGVARGGRALGLAGFSGGGKSTLMLNLMEKDATAFLSNDRLFVHNVDGGAAARGVPKLPRINPGTAIHNPRLEGLIPKARRDALLALPPDELWEIEEKYDVDVERLYGPGRIASEAPLTAFLILNWSRASEDEFAIRPVAPSERRDLLPAVMKSPGPFYQYADGSFFADNTPLDQEAYLKTFEGVSFYEATGRVDFEGAARHCTELLMGDET